MARIFSFFSKKRKRQSDDLPDGNFALSYTIEDDEEYGFHGDNSYYRSLRVSSQGNTKQDGFRRNGSTRDEGNFQRNGSIRRSLQNHKGILCMADLFTTENRKLRQEREFMARRVEFLEEQQRIKESVQNTHISSQETQKFINEKLELEHKLKISEACRVELEQSLTKEYQRTASFENTVKQTLELVTINEQKSGNTLQSVGEIKKILLNNKDEYLQMLSKVDSNTRLVLDRVNSLGKLTSFIPNFKDSKFDRLSDDVKATFRLLGEIVGVRWPKLVIALGLSPEVIEYFRSETQDGDCSQEEIVWRILGIWYKKENDVSLSKLDFACLTIGVSIFSDKPMTREQRLVLNNKYAELIENIDALVVVPYLKKYALIMPNVVDHIINARARPDRVHRLVDSLVTLGDKGLHVFVRALDDSGHGDLAKGILAEEARLLSEAIHLPDTITMTAEAGIENRPDMDRERENDHTRRSETCLSLPRKSDLSSPEVDNDSYYPIGTRYFSDLKVTMKHVEAMLMELAYKDSLK